MNDSLVFVMKVLAISAGLAIAIKQVGPDLPISASTASVLVLVFLPTLIMGAVLGWRSWQHRQNPE